MWIKNKKKERNKEKEEKKNERKKISWYFKKDRNCKECLVWECFWKKNVLNIVTVKKQEIHKLNFYELCEGQFKWGHMGGWGAFEEKRVGVGGVNINVGNFKILMWMGKY